MREIRLSGSEGGGTGNSTGPPYPYLHYRAGGEGWEGARPARNCGENKEARPADTRWPGPLYAYAAQMPKPGSRS